MKKLKQNQGITLIALVVTIVVLLILAATSISMLTGENGIITQAQDAKENNRRGEAEEEIYLYWNEAQINYTDTIEQKVNLLQKRMQEKDANATANIQEQNIAVNYKGYDIFLPYNDANFLGSITYFQWFAIGPEEKACIYITTDSKIYVFNENKKICINDKFEELSNESNLAIVGTSSSGSISGIMLLSNKRLWNLEFNTDIDIFNLDNYTLNKEFDLEEIEQGKYKDKNIRFYLQEMVLLDDGNLYQIDQDKLETGQLPSYFEGMKFKYISVIAVNETEPAIVLIDENGKMYNMLTGENLSDSLHNGIFSNQNIKTTTMIQVNKNIFNIYITEEGKAYTVNIQNNEIKCLNDTINELKDKKITSVYYISRYFEEEYIAIILDNGMAYYTKDMVELYSFNSNGMPDLTVKVS